MLKRKKVRERGKIKLSRYFQVLRKGERVSIARDLSIPGNFPKTTQGRAGIVEGKRGRAYVIRIDIGDGRRFIIHPVHLKKLKA